VHRTRPSTPTAPLVSAGRARRPDAFAKGAIKLVKMHDFMVHRRFFMSYYLCCWVGRGWGPCRVGEVTAQSGFGKAPLADMPHHSSMHRPTTAL
jgi:hypothetical protein